ncbi:excalibur calcium-binding domain-containing protein [Mycobacteroides salmoniphilum]|uniref:excalibur calcium-binding domain-containing protein n=1 Tax=Mycobacteroides salmoniphilum TaxID=404941 RepID=UPI000991C99C|nr:excalibur calcium-binding domain-containing protein [Mycobacteroides salmoniphilum]
MRTKVLYFAITALVGAPSLDLVSAPLAQAYPNCAAARAAGAAPLYRGQPGYSSKLDRDGDGVACETGSSGYSPGQSVPAPALPSMQMPQPVSTPAPAPGLVSGGGGSNSGGGDYETVVTWTGTDCIDITAPDSSPARVLGTTNHCGGTARFTQVAGGGQMVGADPIMGSAESITCEILVGRLRDSGARGDGHDVNCLTRADSLKASA